MEYIWGNVTYLTTNSVDYEIGEELKIFESKDHLGGGNVVWKDLFGTEIHEYLKGTGIKSRYLGSSETFLSGYSKKDWLKNMEAAVDHEVTLTYGDREVEIFMRDLDGHMMLTTGELCVGNDLDKLFTLWNFALEYRNLFEGKTEKYVARFGFGSEYKEMADDVSWVRYIEFVYSALALLYGQEEFDVLLDSVHEFMYTSWKYDSLTFQQYERKIFGRDEGI